MPLEEGLTPLDDEEVSWELGGLALELDEQGDDGLDDVAELAGEDSDAGGDGTTAGDQRLDSRPIELRVRIHPPDADDQSDEERAEAFAASLAEIRKVMSPLPDRTQTRLLRWRRAGEAPKRIAVRPAKGRPLIVPGDINRVVHDVAVVTLRLEAPDPVILSDEYQLYAFDADETATITNEGSFCAVMPGAWWLESDDPVTIENLDFDEYVRFPVGPVTVSRDREIDAEDAYGRCYGSASYSSLFPRWPLLRPGDNEIKASAACNFYWRHTS